jgi:hypothetical protein
MNYLKNHIFVILSFFIVFFATYAAYIRFIVPSYKQSKPSPSAVGIYRPLEEFEKYLLDKKKEMPKEAAPLLNKNTTLKSTHYMQEGSWHLLIEAFFEQDLQDFIAYFHEKNPYQDVLLLNKNEQMRQLILYTEFMQSEKWLSWIQKSHSIDEDCLENWKKIWTHAGGKYLKKIHLAALKAKRKHLENSRNSFPELETRCQGLFNKGNKGKLEIMGTPLIQNQNQTFKKHSQPLPDFRKKSFLNKIINDHFVVISLIATFLFIIITFVLKNFQKTRSS